MLADQPSAERRFAASSVFVMLSFAFLLPNTALQLSHHGYLDTHIGLFVSANSFGVLLALPFTSLMMKRWGAAITYRLGLSLSTSAVALAAFRDGYLWWCAALFIMGNGGALIYAVAQSALASLTPRERVGRVTSLYQMFLGLTFVVASLASGLPALNYNEIRLIAVFWHFIAWLPILHLPNGHGAMTYNVYPPRQVHGERRTKLFCAALASGVFENGLYSLGAVQAAHVGYLPTTAILVPAVVAAGSLVSQYPLGWLSDRISASRILKWLTGFLLASGPLLAMSTLFPITIWIATLIWGIAGGALFTIAMIQVAQRFQVSAIASATTLMIFAYTIGSLIGPTLAGAAMDISPAFGLAALCSLFSVVLIVLFKKQDSSH